MNRVEIRDFVVDEYIYVVFFGDEVLPLAMLLVFRRTTLTGVVLAL